MPDNKRNKSNGPFPSPKILEGYKKISPQAPGRIISMVEQQAKHRQKLEREIVESNIKNEKEAGTMLLLLQSFWF